MKYNELINIQNEFISLSDELINSNRDTFEANLSGFKNFCNSNQIIINILKPISETNFNGIEYFYKRVNPEHRFEEFAKPKTKNELLKVSYDVLWSNTLNSAAIWQYAMFNLNPDTRNINQLLQIGNNAISQRLIKYIDLELSKLINNAEKSNNSNQYNFNIKDAAGSIIGTQTNATINNGLSFDEIEKIIKSKNIDPSDEKQLLELNDYVKTLTEKNIPMSKGILSRFGDIINKYSWIIKLTVPTLIKHFIGN